MTERILIEKRIQAFYAYLIAEEKSAATVEKYMRDVYAFADFVDGSHSHLVQHYYQFCQFLF